MDMTPGKCVRLLAAIVACSAPSAHAQLVHYVLDQSNVNASPLADGANYVSVQVDDGVPNRVTFTITSLPLLTNYAAANFGIQEFGFNVLGSALPLADASGSNAKWLLPAGWSARVAPPPNQLDGFGRFEVSVASTGSNRLSTLTFSIIDSGLAAFSFAENSTGTAGEGNAYFAAHVTGFNAAYATSGYFGGSKPAPVVPIPAGVWLFGSAALVLLRRRARPVAHRALQQA